MSQIQGPKSYYGEGGKTSVECEGVRFTFHQPPSIGITNETNEIRGQFPAFYQLKPSIIGLSPAY